MSWTDRYIGLPFGDAAGEVTCWSLVRAVLRDQCGIILPEYGEISARDLGAIARAMRDGQRAEWADPWLVVPWPKTFDVVLMYPPAGRFISHVGIMVSHADLLHVEKATHSCVVDRRHFSIRNRIAGYRRHRSLA